MNSRSLPAPGRSPAAPILAGITVVCALSNLVLALPRISHAAGPWIRGLPLELTQGGRAVSVLTGLFLLAVARGLARRKHGAWQVALFLFTLSALTHPLKGKAEEAALLSVALLVALLLLRREFWVKGDPVSLAGGWAVMGLTCLAGFLYAAAGLFLLRRHLSGITDLGDAVFAALGLLMTLSPPGVLPLNREAAVFVGSVSLIEIVGLFAGLSLMLAPFIDRRRIRGVERPRVDPLLRRFGASSPSYFALERDTRYYFLAGGAGVVPYTYTAGVALVAGEPLCAPERVAAACVEFAGHCEAHGWEPAYYQVGAELRRDLAQADFSGLEVGEEGFFELPRYTLGGPLRAGLRHGSRRTAREGVEVSEHVPGVPGSEARQARMEALSDAWLRAHGGREMGYLLGGLSFGTPRDRRYFTAELSGRCVGLVTFVPIYARKGMVLDMMRRAPDAPPGTMESLIHAGLSTFAREGLEVASLGLSPLAGLAQAEPTEAGRAQRVLLAAFERLNRMYNFRTLCAFKKRLGPDTWEPRYLAFRGPAALPRIALALIRVHQPRSLIGRWLGGGRAPKSAPAAGARGAVR